MKRNVYLLLVLIVVITSNIQAQILHSPVSFLSEYIKIRSIQGHEGEAGEFLSRFCRDQGLHVRIFSDEDSSYNFIASLYPLSSGKPNIVFLNHLDVVLANDSLLWQYPPFSGTIVHDAVWGRGAIDCKGLAVMQLFAILSLVDSAQQYDLPFNVSLLCVSGEETNSANGSGFVASNFLHEIKPVVIFGEGGSGIKNLLSSDPDKIIFGISIAEKQMVMVKLTVKSESFAHGAGASELYANKKLLRALIKIMDDDKYLKFDKVSRDMFKQLGKYEGGIRGFVIRHINWNIFWPLVKKKFREGQPLHLMVYNTATITNISNPVIVSNNQVAEEASAYIDFRLLPGIDHAKFLNRVKNIVGSKVKISLVRVSPDANPSVPEKYFNLMADALKEVYPGSEVMPVLFPATTDNNFFRRQGIPVYGIIPAVLSAQEMKYVHGKDEQISFDELNKGTEVITKFLEKLLEERILINDNY